MGLHPVAMGRGGTIASLPGLSLSPVLNGCSRQNGGEPGVLCYMICNTVIKNWSWGRPGNKASEIACSRKGVGLLATVGT